MKQSKSKRNFKARQALESECARWRRTNLRSPLGIQVKFAWAKPDSYFALIDIKRGDKWCHARGSAGKVFASHVSDIIAIRLQRGRWEGRWQEIYNPEAEVLKALSLVDGGTTRLVAFPRAPTPHPGRQVRK